MDRIVLAYDGGLETSAGISWLAGKYRAEVVTLTLDVGEGKALDDMRERALAVGAVRAHVLDVREEFARHFVLPALQAGAMGQGRNLLTTALSRPLIARKLVEIAHMEGARAIAHGERRPGTGPTPIELSLRALDPAITVIALAQAWGLSQADLVRYAKERGIPVPAEDVYRSTKSPAQGPDAPAYVEVEFERGVPVTLNGIAMSLVELTECLETIAGAHAIGRGDGAPAALVLHTAHQGLQQLVTTPELERLSAELGVKYTDLVQHGLWDTPIREAIDALVANVQQKMTGTVRVKLHKGDCRVVGRSSPKEVRDEHALVRPLHLGAR